MIRVFLADDHAIFRDGLRRILEASGLRVVGEADDARGAIEAIARTPCDVLVLDLAMPGGGGVEVLRQVHEAHRRLGVVILSMYAEDQYAARLMKAGARAYLTKGRSSTELVTAIQTVARGGRYVTESIAERGAAAASAPHEPHARLTPREHQVFTLLAQGKTPSDIAGALDLAPSTVSTYIARIKVTLDAESVGDIVRYASRMGIS